MALQNQTFRRLFRWAFIFAAWILLLHPSASRECDAQTSSALAPSTKKAFPVNVKRRITELRRPAAAGSVKPSSAPSRTAVQETHLLQERVRRLEAELARTKAPTNGDAADSASSNDSPGTTEAAVQPINGEYQQPPALPPAPMASEPMLPAQTVDPNAEPVEFSPGFPNRLPLFAGYGYNFGGGFTELSDVNEEFTVRLQNQLTLDGTFYDQPNMPTPEKGFNIPFYRTYLSGNVTKDWDYQLAVQGGLGDFNVLDAWVNHNVNDALHFRMGRMLAPFLYENWSFSPAWEPVITNSPLFQVSGKRQLGLMAWGRLSENQAQYQAGLFNGIEGGFYDLDRSVDFLGSLTFTPWKGTGSSVDSLGFGFSVQTGMQNYALNLGNTSAFINGAGEPTLNFNYINSTGVPFFQYNDDVVADGWRTKVAPHFFWYGRISLQAEYVWQQRVLADATTRGTTILNGYQATLSYLMTGESRSGDGLGGWSTVIPRAPFSPSRGEWGPGAWELAFQYSGMDVGTDNFHLGFADTATSTNRLNESMLGLNWWPNRFTRISFDWVNDKLNRPVPVAGQMLDQYNIYWTRAAMFF